MSVFEKCGARLSKSAQHIDKMVVFFSFDVTGWREIGFQLLIWIFILFFMYWSCAAKQSFALSNEYETHHTAVWYMFSKWLNWAVDRLFFNCIRLVYSNAAESLRVLVRIESGFLLWCFHRLLKNEFQLQERKLKRIRFRCVCFPFMFSFSISRYDTLDSVCIAHGKCTRVLFGFGIYLYWK